MDLIGPAEWPVVQKYGLVPAMTPGAGTIRRRLNRKENHAKLEKQMRGEHRKGSAAEACPT